VLHVAAKPNAEHKNSYEVDDKEVNIDVQSFYHYFKTHCNLS